MWQVAVAAAVAGSGIIAKHIFSPNSHTPSSEKPTQTERKQEQVVEETAEQQPFQISNIFCKTQNISNCLSFLNHNESKNETRSSFDDEENGVFWFTSCGSGNRPGSCSGSKKLRCSGKKSQCFGKKISGTNIDNGSVFNQRKNCGKRVSVLLKRRKTTRNSIEKCDSSVSNDCSYFGWGLGLGMMYMMSAGKADISKLSSTIDKTAKVVHELKSELNKQKPTLSSKQLNSDGTRNTVDTMLKPVVGQEHIEICPSRSPIDTKIISHLAGSGYASSVLTEEHHGGAEMDQLQAEFESELQKLPWCSAETNENVESLTNFAQIARHEPVNQSSTSYQSDGVSPAELKNKLSTLLIEQQENHISELESELNLAHSKLQEKEVELRALKDCVRRLTEFSLSTVSDEETEGGEEQCRKLDHENTVVADNVIAGKKRAMHFRTYG